MLNGLPALREFELYPRNQLESEEIAQLRAELSSWDDEFREKQRVQPNMKVETVDQSAFDHFDTNVSFGLHHGETDREMLDSERSWLLGRIEQALSCDFEKDADFILPYRGGFRRSDTLVLYTLKAYDNFREIGQRVQQLLCECRNEWIIYFQSSLWEGPDTDEEVVEDFICWLHRDKVVTTDEYRVVIDHLLGKV
jgi:hypothetical protein